MKRVFIVHGWDGNPEEGWFPWLKKELELRNFQVIVPQMPNAETPRIDEWVTFLSELVGEPQEEDFFVGHSIGCQTIMRYLESIAPKKVGGAEIIIEHNKGHLNGPADGVMELPIVLEKLLKIAEKK